MKLISLSSRYLTLCDVPAMPRQLWRRLWSIGDGYPTLISRWWANTPHKSQTQSSGRLVDASEPPTGEGSVRLAEMDPLQDMLPDPDGDGTPPAIDIVEGVEVTYTIGAREIWCEWPKRSRRSGLSSIMRVRYLAAEPQRLALSSTTVGLYSTSGKNAVAAAMRKVSPVSEADSIVHNLVEHLLGLYRKAGETIKPQPALREGDTDLLYPIWPATEGTIVGAATNSYKSWIALAAAVQTTLGVEILQGNTHPPTNPIPILYLDWETNAATFAERLYAILKGYGLPLEPCIPYRQMTQPLTDAAESIRDEIKRQGYGGSVIDSLSAAVGGSLNEDEPANAFWNAVSYLDVPSLVTAHKSDEAIRKQRAKVFGSVMHHNRPRMIWDAIRQPDSPLVAWTVTDDNNTGRKGQQLAWRIDIKTTGEKQKRRLDTVTFVGVNPDNVKQPPPPGGNVPDLMHATLVESGPMMFKELALILGRDPESIRTTLYRHKTRFRKREDARWEAT